jgi:hypothetical protein
MIYISFDIGVKNLAVCIIRRTEILEILDWRIIELASSKKEVKGVDNISERIYIEMDNIIGELKNMNINMIDYVLIENQPSNLNGIMKTIQYLIYGYFSLIKYWDKEVENVILVNASLKTKNHIYVINMEEKAGKASKASKASNASNASKASKASKASNASNADSGGGEGKNKKGFRRDKYKNNKMLSIELCREYISDDEELQKIFNENKKKDDLSDACLQAVSYIRSNEKDDITNKYNKLYSSRFGNNEDNEKEEAS